MAVRGEKPWPSAGTFRGRPWGIVVSVPGEFRWPPVGSSRWPLTIGGDAMKKRGLRFTEDPSAVTLGVFGTTSVKGDPMGQYVAIDLHKRRSLIVRADENGERLETVRIENDPVTLARTVAAAGEHPEVVLEATCGWYWASDVLAEIGANVHLAHPLGLNWDNRRVKNDEKDANALLDMLRLGVVPEAWIAPPPVRELREVVRYRAKLVMLRSGLKSQVQGVRRVGPSSTSSPSRAATRERSTRSSG